MAGWFLSADADAEFSGIIHYVEQESGTAMADRLRDSFYRTFDMLAENPRIGRLRDQDAAAEVRSWIIHSYFVLYDASSEPLEITRIVHGARDVDRVLGIE